jgi:hypothetical protein
VSAKEGKQGYRVGRKLSVERPRQNTFATCRYTKKESIAPLTHLFLVLKVNNTAHTKQIIIAV